MASHCLAEQGLQGRQKSSVLTTEVIGLKAVRNLYWQLWPQIEQNQQSGHSTSSPLRCKAGNCEKGVKPTLKLNPRKPQTVEPRAGEEGMGA
jgi:hypothetical protein